MVWSYLGWWLYFAVMGEGALAMFCELNDCSGTGGEYMGSGDVSHALNHAE
jgi:hypothetical protein